MHLANDQIVEHTKYCENYYGTLRSEIEGRMKLGIPVILVIEVERRRQHQEDVPRCNDHLCAAPGYAGARAPSALPSAPRMRRRIQRRLKRAEAEIANSVNYDEHVVNIEVDSCAESIYSIIQFKLQHGSDE